MKYISTLFVAIAVMAVGTISAQTASKLNGQSYTYMMKNADGTGPEIIDKMTFGVGQVTSQELGKTGFVNGNVAERNSGASSEFDLTFTQSNGVKYIYSGTAEGTGFYGTIVYTDASGTQNNMLFRGMLTSEWNYIQEQKAANKKQPVKQ